MLLRKIGLTLLCAGYLITAWATHDIDITQPTTDFVRLRDVDPSILQDIRYAGQHNFVGRPLPGYEKPECWLTDTTAQQLKKIQHILTASGLSLKVYDCYRPQRAVDEFIRWSQDANDIATKQEFYPKVNKKDVFDLEYVAKKSGHSRGATVDLTIISLPAKTEPAYQAGQSLQACDLPYQQRYLDNSIDMGTGYDCFDEKSHPSAQNINVVARHHRELLAELMQSHGFFQSQTEWWHFTLVNEPYPDVYFDFPVR